MKPSGAGLANLAVALHRLFHRLGVVDDGRRVVAAERDAGRFEFDQRGLTGRVDRRGIGFSNVIFWALWNRLARSGVVRGGALAWPSARWAAAAPPPDLKAAPGLGETLAIHSPHKARPAPRAAPFRSPGRRVVFSRQAACCKSPRAGARGGALALQSQVREDPLDHRRFEDGGDDFELATAVRAALEAILKAKLTFMSPGRPTPDHERH